MVDIITSLAQLMAGFLKWSYQIIPNYGWGIVFLTILLRLILFPASISQTRSTEKMKGIQPKFKELKEKYGSNPEEYQRRMLALYRDNNMSVFSGCLPILLLLIQLPIFLAMFKVLREPGIFGIDLANERFFGLLLTAAGNLRDIPGSIGSIVLAVISGGATYFQQKMMTPPSGNGAEAAASMQSTFMLIMPLMMAYFAFAWPAALGIYWGAQSLIGIGQQYFTTKFLIKPTAVKEEKKKPARQAK